MADMRDLDRSVFILHAVDELHTFEISERLGVPRGTVASRLRRARAHLRQNRVAVDLASEIGIVRKTRVGEPGPLRQEAVSPFAYALLDAGASIPRLSSMDARSLAARLAARPDHRRASSDARHLRS
jgi:hypothetical protein